MITKRKILFAAVAAASTFVLSSAYATWDNGGWGVVAFDQSVNPSQIIFLDQVRPYEQSQSQGTNRTDYVTVRDLSNAGKMHDFGYLGVSVRPEGFLPGLDYDPTITGVDATRLTITGPTIWSHVSKSSGQPCTPGATNCPAITQISGSSTCSFNAVKLAIKGELGVNSGGVEVKVAKERSITTPPVAGIKVAVTKEWTKGWQTCQTEQTAYTCPAGSALSFNSVAYATSELRSRYGQFEFKPTGGTFYFTNRYRAVDVAFCENVLKGNYVAGGFIVNKQARCNDLEYSSAQHKPSWQRFEIFPIPDSASNPSVVGACRYIKSGATP